MSEHTTPAEQAPQPDEALELPPEVLALGQAFDAATNGKTIEDAIRISMHVLCCRIHPYSLARKNERLGWGAMMLAMMTSIFGELDAMTGTEMARARELSAEEIAVALARADIPAANSAALEGIEEEPEEEFRGVAEDQMRGPAAFKRMEEDLAGLQAEDERGFGESAR